ncbi:Glucose-methanol-choline (GMC) oxidoreductase:NAD binding site (plasmid) [Sinorhizobium sojae CCBAU 05684]|uniref:Glucose-methanol-choline (GMC) oxidoreductase:NAD binding site n=1 Tax=Sinorhizobium sojae CCBAU 05684 TaxID=716928 RepID=A0A249PLT3_9HYPH|nr:GMC family oxidoreductase [Sinorhizobium sojae]ASY66712.1 Glucose-methanol-choline (GMC) oxidoreductase:NAD binding site [Sinorhizobium sojae CCBAU 05684]
MVLEIRPDKIAGEHFDVIVIGSGFGSAFFLHGFLQRRRARILLLEWGRHNSHAWQLEHGANTDLKDEQTYSSNATKPWNYTIGLGGGTNCWFAQTPRLHPNDFRLKSLYGVGQDWPIGYEDLEPFYCEAETVMSISGDPDMAAIMPRSRPFPQPPHRMSTPDRLMKAAQPDRHFVMPTARARVATETRSACCASLRCWLCPADAKFTANNGLMHVFEHPDISVCLGSEVRRLDHSAGSVRAVTFRHGGTEHVVTGDLFVLGANGIQSAAIMLRSGLGGEFVGRGLHESYGRNLEAYLDGVDNFDGSTITTGLNFGLYDGEHRSKQGAALVYFENRWQHGLRAEKGRLRQTLPLVIVTEDLLEAENFVSLDESENAFINYKGAADYAVAGMARALEKLPEVLAPLPVEKIMDRGIRGTESHVQGTLRMGRDRSDSVVDRGLVHHEFRNLVIVGTSTFPSCSCANPSLTAAALSLRAASHIA